MTMFGTRQESAGIASSGTAHRKSLSKNRRGLRARVVALAGLIGLLALTMSACATTAGAGGNPSGSATVTVGAVPGTPTIASSGYPVKVYFSRHPDSDNDPAKVYMVGRSSPTKGVATYAIQQLIAGPSASEQSTGLYTPLSASLSGASNCGGADFTIALDTRGSKPEQGTATLRFCRTVMLAGDLTGGRIAAEIDATLLQFPNIKQVVILTQSGGCFNDFKGSNDCLK